MNFFFISFIFFWCCTLSANEGLIKAVRSGEIKKVISALIEGADVNYVDQTTALHEALRIKDKHTARSIAFYLLLKGADPLQKNHRGLSSVLYAAKRKDMVILEMIKQYLSPEELFMDVFLTPPNYKIEE